jgi:hypothetical protein
MKRKWPLSVALTLCALGCWGRFVDIGSGDASANSAPDGSAGYEGSANSQPPNPGPIDALTPPQGPDASNATPDGMPPPPPTCDPTTPHGPCTDTQSDPRNCGACGHDCLGGPCNAGKCGACALVISSDLDSIALDDTYVYYTERDQGAVSKVALSGGPPTKLANRIVYTSALSVGPSSVYFAQFYASEIGSVQSIPKDGGAPTVLANFAGAPTAWVFDGTAIHLSVFNGNVTSQFTDVIVPLDGGPTRTLDAGVPLGVNDGVLYFKPLAGGLASRTIDGGPIITLWTGPGEIDAVAFENGDILALQSQGEPGSLLRMPLAGGAPETLVAGLEFSGSLAADASGMYWGENFRLRRRAPDGAVETLYVGSRQFQSSIKTDANAIYWVDTGGGANGVLVKLAK